MTADQNVAATENKLPRTLFPYIPSYSTSSATNKELTRTYDFDTLMNPMLMGEILKLYSWTHCCQ
jgi:hypothetical protein